MILDRERTNSLTGRSRSARLNYPEDSPMGRLFRDSALMSVTLRRELTGPGGDDTEVTTFTRVVDADA